MRLELKEKHAAGAILAVLLAAALVLLVIWAANWQPPEPGTGIPEEKLEYREHVMRLAQEHQDVLLRAVGELETLPENVYELFWINEPREYIMNTGSWKTLENESLCSLLEGDLVYRIERTGDCWDFLVKSNSSIFRSRDYLLRYAPVDPIVGFPEGEWSPYGEGMYLRSEDYFPYSEADFYLQELDCGFWYFYRGLR